MSATELSPVADAEPGAVAPPTFGDRPIVVPDEHLADEDRTLRRARAGVIAVLAAVAVVAPVVLFVAQHPNWWRWIAPEATPMTWLQSTVLVLVAATASLLGFLAVARRDPGRRPWLPWAVLLAGFIALALDERFAVHERVRDRILAPRDIAIPFLPWVAPGDFLMLLLAAAGLAVLPSLWRAVRTDRLSAHLFIAGVVLSLAAVGIDSIDPETWSIEAERVQQSGEEVVELAAGLSFLGALVVRLLADVSGLVRRARQASAAS